MTPPPQRHHNRNNNNNREEDNDFARNFAKLAIGAELAGYACYKLFSGNGANNNQPDSSPSPKAPLTMTSFRKDSKICMVNTIGECRHAVKEIKSYVV